MSSVNKVILVGRLGKDPELRYTKEGQAVCTMSLATNRSYYDKKKEGRQEVVCWHRVIAWGKQGETCKQHLARGRRIYVEGRLERRSYKDKQGTDRESTEVISNSVVFLDSPTRGGETPLREHQRAAEPDVPITSEYSREDGPELEPDLAECGSPPF